MFRKPATFVSMLVFAVVLFQAPGMCSAEEITIDVAPETLNLESDGRIVTVHTSVPYSAVDVTSVYINGLAIDWWKSDNRGYFVAKFSMDAVKTLDGLIIGDYNVLKLVGLTKDDEEFWGEAEIMVIAMSANGQSDK